MEFLVRAAATLRLLAHPGRLKILELLEPGEPLAVHDLMRRLALPQSVVSQHLNQMRRVGLLRSTRKSREVYYALSNNCLVSILNCIRAAQQKERS